LFCNFYSNVLNPVIALLQCGHTVSHALLELSSHQPIGSASSQHQRTRICRCTVTPYSLVPKSAIPRAAIVCLLNCRIDPISFSAGKSNLVPTPPYSVDSTSVLFPEALPGTMAASIPRLSPHPSSVRNWPLLKCPPPPPPPPPPQYSHQISMRTSAVAFSGKVLLSHTLSINLLSGVATDHTCREGGREGGRKGGREGGGGRWCTR